MDSNINKPLISAVMIVYNGECFIEKAIDSILNQSFKNFELLILNDGSTDDTENIIKRKIELDSRIIYLKNDTNYGLSYSRNKIINHAQGEYIIVTDADDISFLDRFENQVNYMILNPHIDIYGAFIKLINEADKQFECWEYPIKDKDIKEGLANACIVANPSCIFKKNVFITINGYDENLTICEDWDFFVRASHFFNFANSDKPNIYYRIHNNNISKSKLEKTVIYALFLKYNLDKKCLTYTIEKFIENYPYLKNALAIKATQFYCFWIETYFKMGYKNTALDLLEFMSNNFCVNFNSSEKRLYHKNIISMCLKIKEYKLLLISFKKYIFVRC